MQTSKRESLKTINPVWNVILRITITRSLFMLNMRLENVLINNNVEF